MKTVEVSVQVNGKTRAQLCVDPCDTREAWTEQACSAAGVDRRTVDRVIFIPGRIINIVIL